MIRTLLIDLNKKEVKNEIINEKTLDYSIKLHLDNKTYEKDPYENNLTIFSVGYSKDKENINSLIIYRSPITGSIDINLSSFGKYIKLTGNDLIILKGKADKKYFLIIDNDNVIFLEDEISEDLFKKKEEYYNTIKDIYSGKDFIILLEGLGSKYTIYGNLIVFEGNKIKATKGGIGSILYNYHNITGLSIGGDNKIEIKKLELDFEKVKYHESIKEVYELISEKIPILNFRNIYFSEEENKKIFNDYIDPLIKNLKKEYPYEPFNMLGPFIGIFDENLISDLINTANKYGLDTLYLGYILGLIMEGLYLNKITIKDLEKPGFDINNLSSEKNYNIAKYLIEKIAYEELSILGKNIRYISNVFNINDISFCIPLGNNYSSIINPYLSLGLFLPNLIYDKYFSDHLMNIFNPKDYAIYNFGRLESTYEINNISNEFSIEKNIKKEEIFKKMLEYQMLSNSLPDKNYPKRVIDIYNYLSKRYNINYSFDQYFDEYYKSYLELINKAPVV
ncbi:hypothetical protein YN1_0610 [Nanoarchaeota archaeon]